MTRQMSKSEVLSYLLERLDLQESEKTWLPAWMSMAATRLKFAINAARKAGIPIAEADPTVIQQIIQLSVGNQLTRYHLEKAIEAHYDAHQAALAVYDRTIALFAADLNSASP